jgi:hypothetical protein
MATAKKAPTTAVAVKKNTGVVSVADAMAAMQAMVSGLAAKTGAVGGNTIRVTQDKQFMLPDGSKTADPLQVVIVDFTSMNVFYENDFDKNNITPPACFAIGDVPSTLAPSANSPVKQADDCASCPMAAWGSGKNGGKACKNSRVMAVQLLVPDSETGEPSIYEDTPLWLIKTSPTAIKGFDSYVKTVQRLFGVPPMGVVTTIDFDQSQTYATLTFSNPVPNQFAGITLSRLDEAKELLAQEPDVSSYGTPVAMPASRKGATAAAPRRPVVARR